MQIQNQIDQSSVELSQKEKEFVDLVATIIVNATLKEFNENNETLQTIDPLTFNF